MFRCFRDETGFEDELDPLKPTRILTRRARRARKVPNRRRTEYRFAVGRALQPPDVVPPPPDATSEAFIGLMPEGTTCWHRTKSSPSR